MGEMHVQNPVLSPRTRVTFNKVTRPPRAPVPKQPSWSREGSHRVAQPPGQFQPERRQERGGRREKPGEGAWRWSTAHDPCELDPEALGICTVISFIPATATIVGKSSQYRPEDYWAELCRTAGARTSRLERGASAPPPPPKPGASARPRSCRGSAVRRCDLLA